VRGRVEAVLDWAKVRGYRVGENPARWRGHLDHLLPAKNKVRRVVHHAALLYVEVPELVSRLREEDGNAARALEFIVLTAGRLGEVLGATWNEVDLNAGIWTVPATRMKAGKEHRVPLSTAAVAVLEAMREKMRRGYLIFESAHAGKQLAGSTVGAIMRRLAPGFTIHGLRSSFRDWAAERTNFPREVAEMALAHAVGSAVERAYQRSDLFERRVRLMEAWAEFCGMVKEGGTVVPMRGK
jgi:integrase